MKTQIVSFHCVLKNKLGQVLSSSFNKDVINQLAKSPAAESEQKLRGLVAGIQNVRKGEKREISVPASEAYGLYDPKLVLKISRSDLLNGKKLAVGSQIMTQSTPGNPSQVYRVIEATGNQLVLDGNHPLAGQDLVFEVEVVSVRKARREDFETPIASGYIH